MDHRIHVVRGREIVEVEREAFRAAAARYERVVVDVGTGDGRWIYRLARAHPAWWCLGVDAGADRLREISFRASRKPSRGGTPNAVFVRAAIEWLPSGLLGLADEVHVLFPWGSLLGAARAADPGLLSQIAGLGKPGAAIEVRMNASAVDRDGGHPSQTKLQEGYARAGIHLQSVRIEHAITRTSWGRRLAHGGPVPVVVVHGVVMAPLDAAGLSRLVR